MAAGLGTRLRPLTDFLPKPMMPVANRPVLHHLLNLLNRHEIRDVGINVHAFPELIEREGGTAIRTKAGHSIIKPQMRKHNATFGGEHSAHFYFRDNYFADSGIIAMLTVAELVGRQEKPISELLAPIDPYVRSGEINSEVHDQEAALQKVEERFAEREDAKIDHLDGLTVDLGDWWFNLRPSNTEPLLRLNVEASDDETLERERDELLALIRE